MNTQRVLLRKQAGVAVAQKTEIMFERVVVRRSPPVFTEKRRYEQKQGRPWLMEIRHHAVNNLIIVARCNDYAGGRYQCVRL